MTVGAETISTRARLQLVSDNGSGRAFDLTQERVNIGRDDSNIICVNDDTVSSHHALLVRIGDHFKLRDLISTNGTYLNGERIMDAMLRHGDVLRFGEVEMRYEELEGAPPPVRTESPRTGLPLGRSRPIPSTPAGDRQFRIIGADGRAYGPVDGSTVRQWILQGFANAHTWVPAESRGNWKRLQDFPEFSDALATNEIPTNLLDTPPREALCEETIKVGPSGEPEPAVIFPEAAPAAEALGTPPKRKQRGVSVYAGVVLLIAVGGTLAAWWYDQWPFNLRGPLRRYAHGADSFIYSDPDFVAAETAEDAKDFARLLKNAKQLVADYPDSSLAHYILGVAYGKLNFFADAAPVFEQLIKFTPRDAQVWSHLGGAYAGQGHEAAAIAAYQMAIQLKPDYADAHFNLGVAYASQGKFEDAVKFFRRALKYQTDLPEAWFNLGVVSSRQGSNDEAAVFFQQAVKFRPDYAEAWGGLVKTYLAMHETEKAGEAARELKRIDPARADQLADELSREEPKPIAETPPSEVPQADPPQPAAE